MNVQKVLFLVAGIVFSTSAYAGNPTVLLGLAFDFGADPKDNIGLTAKIISNNEPDNFIFGVGGTYFPFAKDQIGVDLSGGYLADHSAVTAGYDFMRWTPQLSAGWVPTR